MPWATSPKTTQRAIDDFCHGYAKTVTRIGKERGWPPVTRSHFDAVRGKHGALIVGNPEEVVEKILRHSEALGGISRITFQMDVTESSQDKLLRSIELLGPITALQRYGNADEIASFVAYLASPEASYITGA